MKANRLERCRPRCVTILMMLLGLLAAACGSSEAATLTEPVDVSPNEPVGDITPMTGVDYLPLGARPYVDTDTERDRLASFLDPVGQEVVSAVDMSANVIAFARFEGCQLDNVRARPNTDTIRIEVSWDENVLCEAPTLFVSAFVVPRSGQVDGEFYEIAAEPRVEFEDGRTANLFVRAEQMEASVVPASEDFALAAGPDGSIGAVGVIVGADVRLPAFVDGGSLEAVSDIAAELDGPGQGKLFDLWDYPESLVFVSARFEACEVTAAWAVPSADGIEVGYQEASWIDCEARRTTVAVFAIPAYTENELGDYEVTADTPVTIG